MARYLDHVYHPERLHKPLRRSGPKGSGQFEPIGWDEALATVAERLQTTVEQWGAESVLPYSYGGSMGVLQGGSMDRRFFHRLGASRLERTICSSAGGVGLIEAYGRKIGTAPEDFAHAKLIIAWGANVLATNVHLWPFIVEARRNGAKLYVIDPIRTRLARLADRHFAPFPGSDMALALGLMHVIFAEKLERCQEDLTSLRARAAEYPPQAVEALTGIPASEVVQLAREYATTRPAVIRLNYGVQRSERGGRAVRTIALLPALIDSWQERGGGLQLTASGPFELNRAALERPDLGAPARTINMSRLGRALTETENPPVKALVVYNSNPGAVAPNLGLVRRGLAREDLFTVVMEQFQTDTADYADIVLPATTFLEHTDLYTAYGHYFIQLSKPALEPLGEARRNTEVFRQLAARMGFSEPCFLDSDDDMIDQALDTPSPFLAGITRQRLEQEGFIRLNVPELPGAGVPANFDGGPLGYVPPVESRLGRAEFPLELVSSKGHDSLNATFGMQPDAEAESAVVEMHPSDAEPRGIADGSAVEVFNARGSLRMRAAVGRPGAPRRGAHADGALGQTV